MSLKNPVYILLYWDSGIQCSNNGSIWFSGRVKKLMRVTRQLCYSELLEKLHSLMNLDRKNFKLKVTLRYPLIYGPNVEFAAVPIKDDEAMDVIFNLPSQFQNVSVQLHVAKEPVSQTLIQQGGTGTRLLHSQKIHHNFTGNYKTPYPNSSMPVGSRHRLDANALGNKRGRIQGIVTSSSASTDAQSKFVGNAGHIGSSSVKPRRTNVLPSSSPINAPTAEKNVRLHAGLVDCFGPHNYLDPDTFWSKSNNQLRRGTLFLDEIIAAIESWSKSQGCDFVVSEDSENVWAARCKMFKETGCEWCIRVAQGDDSPWQITMWVGKHTCITSAVNPAMDPEVNCLAKTLPARTTKGSSQIIQTDCPTGEIQNIKPANNAVTAKRPISVADISLDHATSGAKHVAQTYGQQITDQYCDRTYPNSIEPKTAEESQVVRVGPSAVLPHSNVPPSSSPINAPTIEKNFPSCTSVVQQLVEKEDPMWFKITMDYFGPHENLNPDTFWSKSNNELRKGKRFVDRDYIIIAVDSWSKSQGREFFVYEDTEIIWAARCKLFKETGCKWRIRVARRNFSPWQVTTWVGEHKCTTSAVNPAKDLNVDVTCPAKTLPTRATEGSSQIMQPDHPIGEIQNTMPAKRPISIADITLEHATSGAQYVPQTCRQQISDQNHDHTPSNDIEPKTAEESQVVWVGDVAIRPPAHKRTKKVPNPPHGST